MVAGGFDEIAVFLETVPKYGLSWSEYSTAMSLLGLLTVIAWVIGTPVVSAVPLSVWVGAFLFVPFAAGLYHTARQGRTIVHRLLE